MISPKRILIVDDDHDMLEVIGVILKTEGYEVEKASSGEECLKKVIAKFPDLIILDVMMPNINGVQVTRKLRSHPKTAIIPIIMLTALDDRKYMKSAIFDLGVEYYITKPFDEEDLKEKVRDAIRYRRPE